MRKVLLTVAAAAVLATGASANQDLINKMNYSEFACFDSSIDFMKAALDPTVSSKADIIKGIEKEAKATATITKSNKIENAIEVRAGDFLFYFFEDQTSCSLAKTADTSDFSGFIKQAEQYPIYQTSKKKCVNAVKYWNTGFPHLKVKNMTDIFEDLDQNLSKSRVGAKFFKGEKIIMSFNTNHNSTEKLSFKSGTTQMYNYTFWQDKDKCNLANGNK